MQVWDLDIYLCDILKSLVAYDIVRRVEKNGSIIRGGREISAILLTVDGDDRED